MRRRLGPAFWRTVGGAFALGSEATSMLLPGFAVEVAALFGVIDDLPE